MSFAGVSAALKKGRLPHALLFLGPAGSGQKEAVRELACALLGVEEKNVDNHPDLHFLRPEEDSRALKLDEVRRLIAEAHLKPFQAPAKLFVIEPAEALNEVSQNALLKTLEEPPARTYIVLVCHAAEKLLPTVRSRTQTVHFRPSSPDVSEEKEFQAAAGLVTDFLSDKVAAKRPDLSALSREEVLRVLERAIGDLRDKLVAAARAGHPGHDTVIDRIETLAEFKQKIEHNVNTKLALSVLWEEL